MYAHVTVLYADNQVMTEKWRDAARIVAATRVTERQGGRPIPRDVVNSAIDAIKVHDTAPGILCVAPSTFDTFVTATRVLSALRDLGSGPGLGPLFLPLSRLLAHKGEFRPADATRFLSFAGLRLNSDQRVFVVDDREPGECTLFALLSVSATVWTDVRIAVKAVRETGSDDTQRVTDLGRGQPATIAPPTHSSDVWVDTDVTTFTGDASDNELVQAALKTLTLATRSMAV